MLSSRLSARFRVIRLDLPGFGGSEAPPDSWFIRDYAQFVAGFLKKIKIDQLEAIIGHSFGGRVAIKGISDEIIHAHHTVLIDSAGIKPIVTLRMNGLKLAARVGKVTLSAPGLRRFAPNLRQRLYQSVGSNDYMNAGPMRQIFLNTIKEDLTLDAARIKVPVLLIWGEQDEDTPVSDARALADAIPQSTLTVLSGAGHFAHTDKLDIVQHLIEEFLS
jgi:pimeloyl-ACP methyl ester carboxylesterase